MFLQCNIVEWNFQIFMELKKFTKDIDIERKLVYTNYINSNNLQITVTV